MRYSFDTSAFLPCVGRKAEPFRNSWERYTLSMTETQHEAMLARRERIAEECGAQGIFGPLRAYDRQIVKRFSI